MFKEGANHQLTTKESMYAIVKLQGKQFKVEKGSKITVDRLPTEIEKDFTSEEVLLVNDNGKVQLGAPFVAKATIKFKVLDHTRGDKIRVLKYKSKSRYRKLLGHRQLETELEVVEIKA